MATMNCPGCGLPRAISEDDKPCPVCEAGGHDLLAEPRSERTPHPTDGMPADNSQLASTKAEAPHGHRPEIVIGVVGVIIGVVLAVAVQSLLANPSAPDMDAPRLAAPAPVAVARPAEVPTAMVPQIPAADETPAPERPEDPSEPPPAAAPGPVAPLPIPGDGKHLVLDIDMPDGSLTFPSSTWYKPGMRMILRGRLRHLTIGTVEAGSVVDASGLVAQKIVLHKVDNSIVKLKVPNGEVAVISPIVNGSEVVIDAPNSEVVFRSNGSGKEPRIEGGSRVKVTARQVMVTTSITGEGTHFDVTLDNGGSLKIPKVEGSTVVEYRKSSPENDPPRIDIATTGPKATVRRVE